MTVSSLHISQFHTPWKKTFALPAFVLSHADSARRYPRRGPRATEDRASNVPPHLGPGAWGLGPSFRVADPSAPHVYGRFLSIMSKPLDTTRNPPELYPCQLSLAAPSTARSSALRTSAVELRQPRQPWLAAMCRKPWARGVAIDWSRHPIPRGLGHGDPAPLCRAKSCGVASVGALAYCST